MNTDLAALIILVPTFAIFFPTFLHAAYITSAGRQNLIMSRTERNLCVGALLWGACSTLVIGIGSLLLG